MANYYFPRSAAVRATQLTADTIAFMLDFNQGKTGHPLAVDNGSGVFIATAAGVSTEIQIGTWVVEGKEGVEFRDDAQFCGDFYPAT